MAVVTTGLGRRAGTPHGRKEDGNDSSSGRNSGRRHSEGRTPSDDGSTSCALPNSSEREDVGAPSSDIKVAFSSERHVPSLVDAASSTDGLQKTVITVDRVQLLFSSLDHARRATVDTAVAPTEAGLIAAVKSASINIDARKVERTTPFPLMNPNQTFACQKRITLIKQFKTCTMTLSMHVAIITP